MDFWDIIRVIVVLTITGALIGGMVLGLAAMVMEYLRLLNTINDLHLSSPIPNEYNDTLPKKDREQIEHEEVLLADLADYLAADDSSSKGR